MPQKGEWGTVATALASWRSETGASNRTSSDSPNWLYRRASSPIEGCGVAVTVGAVPVAGLCGVGGVNPGVEDAPGPDDPPPKRPDATTHPAAAARMTAAPMSAKVNGLNNEPLQASSASPSFPA